MAGKYKDPWIPVEKRKDLGRGGTTRVMMFVRGVGPRLGTMTVLFEKPWKVIDPDWHGEDRDLNLEDVACYYSLEDIPWPTMKLHYKTQQGQPYGSESRKCEQCGTMLWGIPGPGVAVTDDFQIWLKSEDRCQQ